MRVSIQKAPTEYVFRCHYCKETRGPRSPTAEIAFAFADMHVRSHYSVMLENFVFGGQRPPELDEIIDAIMANRVRLVPA